MSNTKIYQPVWNKYIPVIIMKIKSAVKKNELQQLGMDKLDLMNASNRKNTKFSFTLEMKEGRIVTNKNNTSIAREFATALNENEISKDLLKSGHFKFAMDNKFVLSIQVN